MTKKVLVTGVSGFLGHHCATELIKSGYFVKGTVRDLRRKNEVLNGIKKEVDPNEKIEFIDSTIKDAYLEKFKIYCLTFNNKKSQAQLLLDLLREQKQSSKFYDDKINFLLGVTDKTNNKIIGNATPVKPKIINEISATKAPIIKISPCAKFIIPIIP